MRCLPLCVALMFAVVSAVSVAQIGPRTAVPPKPVVDPAAFGTMFMRTNLGSFKVLSPGEVKAAGRITMEFHGTVLISHLEGTVTPGGDVRREFEDKELGKQVWFGRGRMVIDGRFSNVQFFGRDLNATYVGMGIVRLFGEFDRNQETGEYWFADEPTRRPWMTGGMTVTNPRHQREGRANPRIRVNPGAGNTGGNNRN